MSESQIQPDEAPPLNRRVDEEFIDQTIVLDFNHFQDCYFENCTLIYHGQGVVNVEGCHFEDCQWTFSSSAAATLQFMRGMYQQGGALRRIIEEAFNDFVRGGEQE